MSNDQTVMSDEMKDLLEKLEVILDEYEKKGDNITTEEMQEMLAKMRMIRDEVKDPDIRKELNEGIEEFQQMIAEHK